jgi:uncharacterized RDD family membrane protein YckC
MGRAPRSSGSRKKSERFFARNKVTFRASTVYSPRVLSSFFDNNVCKAPRYLRRWANRSSGIAAAIGPPGRVRRDVAALSTLPIQADLAPAWKDEVNRRLALHKIRMASSSGAATAAAQQAVQRDSSGRTRQAAAAARVAARYAKAPSYSEMLADEARAVVRAAEAASRAALQAQAAAESILAGLEAGLEADFESNFSADRQAEPVGAGTMEELWEPRGFDCMSSERVLRLAPDSRIEPAVDGSPLSQQIAQGKSSGISWVADIPLLSREPAASYVPQGTDGTQMAQEEGWEPQAWPPQLAESNDREALEEENEIFQPLHANLIEFPRELIAARRIRPRLVEGPHAERDDRQLSIFEVDPGTISTVPEMASDTAVEATVWQGARWSGMELEAEPAAKSIGKQMEETAPTLHLAPFGLRAMAAVVDGALILGVFLAVALVVATQVKHLPTKQQIELGSGAALLLLGGAYQMLFFMLAQSTPGMKYARISLCTFDDENPTRAQLRSRMVALLLSLLPLGLGVLWAIFDEDHLSWHDRLSGTYQRQG